MNRRLRYVETMMLWLIPLAFVAQSVIWILKWMGVIRWNWGN